MNQQAIKTKHRICFKCGYEADTLEKKCPQCGRGMRTPTQNRILGFISVLCGIFLIGMMSFISFYMYGAINQTGKPGASAKFTGTQNDILMIIAIFGLVIIFGFVALIAGLWQLIFGKANKLLVYLVLGLGLVFYVGLIIFSQFYKS